MRVNGQRWVFEVGNNTVTVENAWVWYGYSQERVRLNDEIVYERKGWGYLVVSAVILTTVELLDRAYGVTMGITVQNDRPVIFCRLITENETIEPVAVWKARWSTKDMLWPDDPDPLGLDEGERSVWQRQNE